MDKRMLVIDGDMANRKRCIDLMNGLGYRRGRVACDGKDGISRVMEMLAKPDLGCDVILIAHALPDSSGGMLAMRLRDLGYRGRIILMGVSDDPDAELDSDYGVDISVRLPLRLEELRAALKA